MTCRTSRTIAEPQVDRIWRLVILETPYAGDVQRNTAYARAAMRDCLLRGEAPMASHLLYTQPGVLNDLDGDERTMGIDAGLAWGTVAEATVVYSDLGISSGMKLGIERARRAGRQIDIRRLPGWRLLEQRAGDEEKGEDE